MKTFLLIFAVGFGPISLAFKKHILEPDLAIDWMAPTGKRYRLDLQKPEVGVFHPGLKYLTIEIDNTTGQVYSTDKSPSQMELKRAEDIHIDYQNKAALKISKNEDGTHSMEGLLDGHFMQHTSAQTSFVKLENKFRSDYMYTNETLTYLAKQKGEMANAQDYVVELAIVVDKEWADVFHHDMEKILKYWAVLFWDVNMRFKTLPSSNISFRITSITAISRFEDQPFIEEARNEDGAAPLGGILGRFGPWMSDNSHIFPKFDMAMCVSNTRNDGYAGMAWVSGACKPRINAVVVADNGRYGGVLVVAHEIAHNLGAPHDGDIPGCTADGFIMAGIKHHFFSECSDRTIEAYVTSDQAACLKRIDEPADPVIDPEQSSMYTPTMNEQCKALRANDSAWVSEGETWNCEKVLCWFGNSGVNLRPVDNTPCLYGRCFRTRCLPVGSLLKNTQSGECVLGKNIFSGNDDAIMGRCPNTPTPLDKFYTNTTASGNLLLMPYSTQEVTENEDKCLQISRENDSIVNFVRCANAGQGKNEWNFESVRNGVYLVREIQTQKCLRQEGTAIKAVSQCDKNDPQSLWYYEISSQK